MTKKKRIYEIDRRTFLQGMGASVIALPLFDFFMNSEGTALAQGMSFPKRYFILSNGVSASRGGPNFLNPASVGANYQLINASTPLAGGTYGDLRSSVGIYSNLYLPFTPRNSTQPAPVAGYKGTFHGHAEECQLSGTRVEEGVIRLQSPSSDQILRMALNPNGDYVHLNLCAQPKGYLGNNSRGGIMQYAANGQGIPPQTSPRQAFNQLFFNFQDTDPRVEAERRLAAEKRKSVLDLISRERVDFLKRELGERDKALLTEHFDKIRDLEKTLEAVPEPGVSATCRKPQAPNDPPLGTDYIGVHQENRDPNIGYSNENLRADLMIDLIHMALTCDIARHGTLKLTFRQSFMNTFAINGRVADYHEQTHSAGNDVTFSRAVAWHVEKFARLVGRLRQTAEGSGTVLDNSAIVLVSEGGGGINSDNGIGNAPHSGYNMTTLLAGRAGGLRPGRHVATNQVHPSRILFSAMRAVGYQGDRLGQVSGVVSELF